MRPPPGGSGPPARAEPVEARGGEPLAAPQEPEKRRRILHAAVRVFAENGYQGCRIADVARAAGVAYGLVYHYFRNKEELLESVFDEQWAIFIGALEAIDAGPGTAPEKVAAMLGFVFDVYRTAPAAVRVLMLEVTHTPQGLRGGTTRETFERALRLIAAVVERGQARGELRPQDPLLAATAVLGAMELTLSAMVMGLVPAGTEEEVGRARAELTATVLDGLRVGAR